MNEKNSPDQYPAPRMGRAADGRQYLRSSEDKRLCPDPHHSGCPVAKTKPEFGAAAAGMRVAGMCPLVRELLTLFDNE